MGKHRSRLQILERILSVISDNQRVKKTRIMYEAYLSYGLLTRYLNDVIKARLVVCDDRKCFKLTTRGEKFLEKFAEYHRSREVVKEKLDHAKDQKLILEQMCPNSKLAKVDSNIGEKAVK